MKRKRKVDGVWEREAAAAPFSQHQNDDYSDTFNQIDKGNDVEAKYNMSRQSRKHGWSPKLLP